jgi:tetratricopeptide (TPR) repeat protein
MQPKLNQAKAAHQAGDLSAAEVAYRSILKDNPSEVAALHFLGVIESQRGNHQVALDLISKAIIFSPGRALFHFNYGVVLHRMGEYEKARNSYDEALELRPQFADAFFKRGELSLLEGDFIAASFDFGQAIAFSAPSALCFQARALARLKLEDFDGALEDLQQIESLDSATFNSYWLKHRVLTLQQRLEAAEAALDLAYAQDPSGDEQAAKGFFTAMVGGSSV